jgi:hypothetical protein
MGEASPLRIPLFNDGDVVDQNSRIGKIGMFRIGETS